MTSRSSLCLDFAAAKLWLRTNQCAGLRVGKVRDLRFLSRKFMIPAEHLSLRHVKMRCNGGDITSVASFENCALVQVMEGFCDSQQGIDLATREMEGTLTSGDSEDAEEKERLRRNKISKANRGNTPWNKGRKHSPETIQKIRERTKLAMQDPKVKMKLSSFGHAQSQETKLKISAGVRTGWVNRRIKLKLQETCYFEWQNLIAESSRNGLSGEEQFSWDSYSILDEQLSKEWLQSVELRKKARKVKCDRRAPKTAEQRKRISLAISAKWNDPAYRDRVCSALAKYHGIPEGSERKAKRIVRGKKSIRSLSLSPTNSASLGSKTKSQSSHSVPENRKGPLYRDPLATSKLEMIKNIRAHRVTDARKTKAIEQARLLIADAEKAANALEIAARKNPAAIASLVEARKHIKEAVELLELVNVQRHSSVAEPKNPSYNRNKLLNNVEKERVLGNQQLTGTDQPRKLILSGALTASNQGFTNSSSVTLERDEKLYPYCPINYPQPQTNIQGSHKGVVVQTSGTQPHFSPSYKSQRSKKTWIRGKLVELTEEG